MKFLLNVTLFIPLLLFAGCSTTQEIQKDNYETELSSAGIALDTIKAGKFDNGKMWTFEYPPVDYFQQEYNFTPSQQWLDNVRLSSLRFATYCSASFISEDGLIMTNNHCARESAVEVSREGEDLQKNGFYAETLADERPVPGLFVDQLVLIKDVTDEVKNAMAEGATEQEQLEKEEVIIAEIEKREGDATGLSVSVTPLYNGGKYSLYGYKRYNDVRLVFTPEHLLGHFGGEYDNFTYPRYNLDFAFFRVYENGTPLKTNHFFKWSEDGAEPAEPVFVVGNPGSTSRLLTVAQLDYLRDVSYPNTLELYSSLINFYQQMIEEKDDSTSEELYVQLLRYLNAQKVYEGMIAGLNDPVLMQRKKDFEKTFKEVIKSREHLDAKYGNLWDEIAGIMYEFRILSAKIDALTLDQEKSPIYFFVAQDVIDLADELNLPEEERNENYTGDELDSTISAVIPEDYQDEINKELLKNQIETLIINLGQDDPLVRKITGGKNAKDAADYMLANSLVDNPEQLRELIKQGAPAIFNSNDLFIYFVINSLKRINEFEQRSVELGNAEEIYTQMLGEALFEVYGTSIPPDATFTLRISDGVVEGYPYNGTIAPPVTTFFGLYDRFYSFSGEYPWDLPEKWQNPSDDFDMSTPFNFVSTNDITGGSSGSPVINKDAEIVGVAFDGNIESLPGSFIFRTEKNRMVSAHSEGILEALSDIYETSRLVDEILNGKIIKKETAVSK